MAMKTACKCGTATIVASLHNGDYKNLICEGTSKMILLPTD
jgi:hypothetical protein